MSREYTICPFCRATDFDLIGLKNHLTSGHCDDWNETSEVSPVAVIRKFPPESFGIQNDTIAQTSERTLDGFNGENWGSNPKREW